MLRALSVVPVPAASSESWFVYILRCADGSLYTGTARDVAKRLAVHEAGKGARYTRSRRPLVLCAVARCASKGQALSLEISIKRLPRSRKLELVAPRRLSAFARAHQRTRARGGLARGLQFDRA